MTGTRLDDEAGIVNRVGNLRTNGHCVEMVLGESGLGGPKGCGLARTLIVERWHEDPCTTGLLVALTLSRPVKGPDAGPVR